MKTVDDYKQARLFLSLITILLAMFLLMLGLFEMAVISALTAIWMKITI